MSANTYKEVKGDLLDLFKKGKFDVIAHGANCQKIMGAGIAFQIKRQFNDAFIKDFNDKRSPIQRWGDFTYVRYKTGDVITSIFNLYTQYNPGSDLDYTALELSLKKLARTIEPSSKIGLPMIGAGIGGGDWVKVRRIIKRVLSEHDVTVVIYDK